MKCNNSSAIRTDYKIFLEPILATSVMEIAQKSGARTRSKYIRYAVINQLIRDGVSLPEKFKPFIDKMLYKGITQ
jgi:hypothetical protein